MGEPTNSDFDADSLLRGIASIAPAQAPIEFVGNERFRIERPLGQGTFGTVFEVFDTQSQSTVALKVLRRPKPEWVARFKREFRALVDVSHPNVVRLHDLLKDDPHWFLTMDLVKGVPLLDGLRVRPELIEDAFDQLRAGVEALHAAGVVHCDLKPSNVLLTAEGQVVILDFGLAERIGEGAAFEGGTLLFMAPEQLRGEQVGFGADWYAVGLMLFQALAGEPPFPAGTRDELTRVRSTGRGRNLSDLAPSAPPQLVRWCIGLLAPKPSDRFMDATESEAFVGRTAELDHIERAFVAAQGRPTVVILSGASGIGKSALAAQYVATRNTHGLSLTARCFEQEAVPFKAVDGALDDLTRFLARLPEEELTQLLEGVELAALSAMVPQARRLLGMAAVSVHDDSSNRTEVRRASFAALRALLDRLARRGPLLLSIDDLQWGDFDSVALLTEILRDVPLRLLITRRDGSAACVEALLKTLRERHERGELALLELAVGPLSAADAEAAVRANWAEAAQEQVSQVARESGGMPFFFRPLRQGTNRDTLDQIVFDRVGPLPAAARELLEVLSLSGRPLPSAMARTCAGSGAAHASAVALLRSERLTRSHGGQLEPYHDKIRDVVVARLSPERRRSQHLRLAQVLSGLPEEEGLVAWHFHQGGDEEQASLFSERAASSAERALAFEIAATHYQKAAQWGPQESSRSARLREGRARALANAGFGASAGELYFALADEVPERSLDLRLAGVDQLLVSGVVEAGLAGARRLAHQVNLDWPATAGRALIQSSLTLLRLWLAHSLGWPRRAPRADADHVAKANVAATIFRGLLPIAPAHGSFFAVTELRLALEQNDQRRISLALARVGAGLLGPGPQRMARIGERMVRHAQRLSDQGDPQLRGAIEVAFGACAFWDGTWSAALERCDRGLGLLRQADGSVTHERNVAAVMCIRSLEELGKWREAGERNEELSRVAACRGDLYALVTASLNAASAALTAGQPAVARRRVDEALGRWPGGLESLQHVYGLRVTLHALALEGQASEAWVRLESVWKEIGRGFHLSARPGRVDLFLTRGRLALAAGQLRAVPECIDALIGVGRADARAHAALLAAGLASQHGNRFRMKERLGEASARYVAAGMQASAQVVEYWRCRTDGALGSGHLDHLQEQGCRAPAAWAEFYAPGLGSSVRQNAR